MPLHQAIRKWATSWNRRVVASTVGQQISKTLGQNNRVPMKFEMELTMIGPAWAQNNSPERLANI
jgi:hypothetical protein